MLAAGLLALACGRAPRPANVLLFTGTGTSRGDVEAVEVVLRDAHLDYATATSRQLDGLTAPQLQAYRLLIVPGGNFEEMGNGLTSSAVATVREAVHGGLNYLGICAGAFLAGDSPYNGLNLTSGVRFPFYAGEARGMRKTPVYLTIAGSPTPVEHYWEDGPQLSGWGDVVARYDDGTPAIAQGAFGSGWVLLLGTHPEAPDSWHRGLPFTDSGTTTRAYAATLVNAALGASPLPHY